VDEAVSDQTAGDEEIEPESVLPETPVTTELSIDSNLDIDAALAAVATLDDMLAEQEAAEQSRIAQAEELAQRQARLQNPELFFPMPPVTSLQRGRMDSVIPALVLLLTGAWLTFTLTTSQTAPDPVLVLLVLAAGTGITLLAHWLSSGRWASGAIFFALLIALAAGIAVFLVAGPGFVAGWPLLLAAPGGAIILTAFLAQPPDRRLILPGLLFIFSGIVGLVILSGLLPFNVMPLAASLWPVVAVLLVIILILPLILRRRRQN
jgi:hypothetical protein